MAELSNENPNIKINSLSFDPKQVQKESLFLGIWFNFFFCQRTKMETAENHVMFGRCVPTQKDLSLSSFIIEFMFGLTD